MRSAGGSRAGAFPRAAAGACEPDAGGGQARLRPGAVPPGRRIQAPVKWVLRERGCGFLEIEGGAGDPFRHRGAVAAACLETLAAGGCVSFRVENTQRGPHARDDLHIAEQAAAEHRNSNGRSLTLEELDA